jgi:hypothetical protein
MGGELAPKKELNLFGPADPTPQPKKKLFDDDGPKKPGFSGDFFKRDDKKKVDPFGGDGFQRQSGAKKLAEIFAEPAGKKPGSPPLEKGGPGGVSPFKEDAPQKSEGQTPPTPPFQGGDSVGPRIPAISDGQQLEFMVAFAKDFGDPEIRDEMGAAVKAGSAVAAWGRVMRKHARAGQQWENYYRKQALYWAECWLSDLGIAWEIVDEEGARG